MRARRLAPLVLALVSCAVPRGTAERPKVSAFEITGAKQISEETLKEKLATQGPDPWWKLFWRGAADFDEDALTNDRKRVERMYQADGFYRASVKSEVVPDGEGRVKVRLRVDEGTPTRVAELRILGLEAAPEARAALGKLPLREGDRFTEAAYDATRGQIILALGRTGYARAEVKQLAEVNPATGEARVTYTVEAGPRYRFGNVFVAGTVAVPRARLRQEADRVFKPGDWFDTTALEKVQREVVGLGVFGGVRVTQGPPDAARKDIPVVITAREAPFRTVRAGPGINIALNRWDVNAVAGWSHRNWLGGLRKLSLDLRLGYAFLPNPFVRTQSGPVGLAAVEFTQPGAIRNRLDVSTRVEVERAIEEANQYWAQRFRVGSPFKYKAIQFAPSYNIEIYEITSGVAVAPAPGSTAAQTNLLLYSCGGSANCLLSYFEQRVALDLRDDPVNTRRGLYLSLGLQEGFTLFGVGFPYLRVLPEARAFVPMWKDTVLAGRFRFGALRMFSSQDPPLVARFYSGGPSLMRAYYTRRLSPMVYSTDVKDYVPVGGSGLVDGGAELRFPVSGNLGGSLFLDLGNVTVNQADAFDPGTWQYGAGFGLRYKTVFGPLRVDVAGRLPRRSAAHGWEMPSVPVLAPTPDGKKLVDTGFRHTEPIISIHLSVGEAY